jgi:uncharacterized protein (DUF39 family)
VNDRTSGNALLIDSCNDFKGMDAPTIQPISVDEDGSLKYRSQGGLVVIPTEKVLDEIIEAMEDLRPHVKKYETSKKQEEKQVSKKKKASKKVSKKVSKKQEETEEVDEKSMEKALRTLISVGHTKEEAKKILKIDEIQEDKDDLPEDIRITLEVLLDKGMSRQEAYKKLGLTKSGKIDKRKRR